MKNWSKKTISGGTILLLSLMFVNVINFIFNAFLGRVLSFEEFGLITLINTFLYIATVGFNALYATVNHKIAYLAGKNSLQKEQSFFRATFKKTKVISLTISFLWLLIIPFIDNFFKIDNYVVPLFFTPIITLGVITAIDKGFLQGKFRFDYVAGIITIEALSKLLFAWIFVQAKLNTWVYVSIPLATLLAFLFARYLTAKEIVGINPIGNFIFPKKFFGASLLTGIASIAFLTFDVLLAKHFLSPTEAGQYALLSLIGKMVYFFGLLPGAFIITSVSNDGGRNLNPIHRFYKLFITTIIFSIGAFIGLGLLGNIFVPILFGSKALAIMPYLVTYAAAIMFYAIASSLVIYHLAKRQYLFPKASVVMAGIMSLGVILFHENVGQITTVIFIASMISLSVLSLLHILEAHVKVNHTERLFTVQYE